MNQNKKLFLIFLGLLIFSLIITFILFTYKNDQESKLVSESKFKSDIISDNDYGCEQIDIKYVVENSIGVGLEEFENLLAVCIGSENIVKVRELTTSFKGMTKYEYLGFGDIFVKNKKVIRIDAVISDRDIAILNEYIETYGDYSFDLEDRSIKGNKQVYNSFNPSYNYKSMFG